MTEAHTKGDPGLRVVAPEVSSDLLRLFIGRCGWRCGNAGDEFAAPLLRELLGREVLVTSEPEQATMFGAGSILDRLTPGWAGVVWGSGLIREDDRIDCRGARPIALRGPLTAHRWSRCPDVAFGDPGLLVPLVWPASPTKRYRVGLLPHFVDACDPRVSNFARRHPDEVTTIDVCGRVADVLRGITECEIILSSSLHGLVFADAYSIPNAWIVLSDDVLGGSFKFRDYRAASGHLDAVPLPFSGNEIVDELIERVVDAWRPPDARLAAGLLDALRTGLGLPQEVHSSVKFSQAIDKA